ncbi:hypothetical protein PVAND_013581 [Polypedilum vanderplanki]|uniref:Ionotropic receptor n=1 Tax=Polypedilum vanderplanki TaxID=319348 RepID=A0A9J6CPU9_POLVA|nr:hypothetical protein PVAND_013581 [Polypedilum vanderplanki]
MYTKNILLINLITIINSFKISVEQQKINDLVKVIDEILENEEIENTKITNIFNFSNATNEDFIKNLYQAIGSKVTIEEFPKIRNSAFKNPWFFNIFIIDSSEQFKAVNFTNYRFITGGYFIIIFENGTKENSHMIFKLLWELYIYNINLLRRENDTIIVETFIPFQPSKCNQTEPVEIAKYKNKKFITKPENFFPQKFRNFHCCPIKVITFETIGPAVLKQDFSNGTQKLFGRDIEIFNTMSELLNFKANIFYNSTYGGWGNINMKGEGYGAMMDVKLRGADLTFGNLNLKLERGIHLAYTIPYSADILLFMIPPSKQLSTFQKLLRPFDKLLWITLCCVLFIAILTITILELQSNEIRDFIIGQRVRAAYLNVLIALIGGAQNKLPRGNFGRFLLMIFLLFCLVIRTLYQGSLFRFLQSSATEKDPETIEEMAIERNFTFYMILSYSEFSRENVYMKGKIEVINPLRIKELLSNVLDQHFQGSLMLKISQVLYSNRERALHGQQLYKVCKEYFMVIPIVMYMPKNSFLIDPFNKLLLLFQQSGLLNYWTSINEDMKFLDFKTDTSDPKELTLEHLSGPFKILFVGCFISAFGFLIEILWFKMKRKRDNKRRNNSID